MSRIGDSEVLNRQNPFMEELAVESAERAGSFVAEQVAAVIQAAETKAEEIRRNAEREAYEIRKDLRDAANRIAEEIDVIERPLEDLVAGLRYESDRPRNGRAEATDSVHVPSKAIEPRRTIPGDRAQAALAEDPPAVGESPSAPFEAGAGATVVAPGEAANPPGAPEPEEVAPEEVREDDAQEVAETPETPGGETAEPQESVADARQEVGEPHETVTEAQPDAAAEEPGPAAELSDAEIEESAADGGEFATEAQPTTDVVDTDREDDAAETAAAAAAYEEHQEEDEQRKAESLGGTEAHESPAPGGASAGVWAWKRALASKRGRLGRSRGIPFITAEGECATCHRTLQVESQEDLAKSGWLINDDVGLCPDCQSQGWQLPEGARLPFRRAGT